MNENYESNKIYAEPGPDWELFASRLRILFLFQCVDVGISVLSLFLNESVLTGWLSRIVHIVTIVMLFQMVSASRRYRKAAIWNCISLCCSLVNAGILLANIPLYTASVLNLIITLAGAICAWIAGYQEYHAHSEVILDRDAKLAEKWRNLFTMQIVVGVVTGLLSWMVTILTVAMQADTTVVFSIIMWVINGVQIAVHVIYLLYLNRMLQLLRN